MILRRSGTDDEMDAVSRRRRVIKNGLLTVLFGTAFSLAVAIAVAIKSDRDRGDRTPPPPRADDCVSAPQDPSPADGSEFDIKVVVLAPSDYDVTQISTDMDDVCASVAGARRAFEKDTGMQLRLVPPRADDPVWNVGYSSAEIVASESGGEFMSRIIGTLEKIPRHPDTKLLAYYVAAILSLGTARK